MSWQRVSALLAVLLVAALVSRPKADPAPIQGYGPGASVEALLLKEIRDDIRGMRQDMRVVFGSGGGGQGVGLTVGDHRAIIKARCASCHAEDVAEEKGKSLALTDAAGLTYEYSALEARLIADQVNKGKMPPGGGLSESEKKVLANIPAKGRKKQ